MLGNSILFFCFAHLKTSINKENILPEYLRNRHKSWKTQTVANCCQLSLTIYFIYAESAGFLLKRTISLELLSMSADSGNLSSPSWISFFPDTLNPVRKPLADCSDDSGGGYTTGLMYDCRSGSSAWSSVSWSINRWCDRRVTLRDLKLDAVSLLSVFNARSGQSNATQWAELIHHKPCQIFTLECSQVWLSSQCCDYLLFNPWCSMSSFRGNLNWSFILRSLSFFWIGDKIRVPVKRVRETSVGMFVSFVSISQGEQRFGKKFFVLGNLRR